MENNISHPSQANVENDRANYRDIVFEEKKQQSGENVFVKNFNSGTLGENIVVVNEEDSKIQERNDKHAKSILDIELNNIRVSNVSKADQKPENRIDYNDLLYKDVLFFFINTYSGSREGLALTNMGVKKVEFVLKCSAYIFNINDEENYKMGVQTVKDYQAAVPNSLAKIIIGGGDGSVLPVIEFLEKEGVNVLNCLFGVLPLGARNDLSTTLGWGSSISLDSDMSNFKKLVLEFAEASSILIDVWEIKLTLDYQSGEIIQIIYRDGKKEKITILTENNQNRLTEFKKSFMSYFSLGYDARVGFGFEKSRTNYRCCNHCLFFWENCKKSCCRKSLPLNGFIDSFYTLKTEEYDNNLNTSEVTDKENMAQQDLVFKSKTDECIQQGNNKNIKDAEEVVLKGDPICLIGQNLNFYLGKSDKLWRTNENVGLEIHNPGKNIKEIDLKLKEERENEKFKHLIQNSDQNMNDSKLEFLTYQSGFCGISCAKIYQGTGPVLIKFKETPERKEDDKYSRIYLNVDGNYYHIVKPLELRIRLNTKYPQKKLKFLCKIKLDSE